LPEQRPDKGKRQAHRSNMLLADKLIKWETGVGTEKGATLLQIINLFLLGIYTRGK